MENKLSFYRKLFLALMVLFIVLFSLILVSFGGMRKTIKSQAVIINNQNKNIQINRAGIKALKNLYDLEHEPSNLITGTPWTLDYKDGALLIKEGDRLIYKFDSISNK